MKLLVDNDNIIIDIAESIEVVGPFIVVYKNNELYTYMNNNETIYDIDSIPEYIKPQQYLYDGVTFTLNPNYVEPQYDITIN